MSRTIHGLSHKGIKAFREKSAALAVYWIYVSRMNNEGVAWPSANGLARDTGWNKEAVLDGRQCLVALQALEDVPDYIRPEWRALSGQERAKKLNLDRSEYYRPTGHIVLNGVKYPMLYNGSDEISDIDDNSADGRNRRPSKGSTVDSVDGRQNPPELDSPSHLDSKSKGNSKKKKGESIPKPLKYPVLLKEWTYPHIDQYAKDNPGIAALIALDGMHSKIGEFATAAGREIIELHQEVTRLGIQPTDWKSIYSLAEAIDRPVSIYRRMLWSVQDWMNGKRPAADAPKGDAYKPYVPETIDDAIPLSDRLIYAASAGLLSL